MKMRKERKKERKKENITSKETIFFLYAVGSFAPGAARTRVVSEQVLRSGLIVAPICSSKNFHRKVNFSSPTMQNGIPLKSVLANVGAILETKRKDMVRVNGIHKIRDGVDNPSRKEIWLERKCCPLLDRMNHPVVVDEWHREYDCCHVFEC